MATARAVIAIGALSALLLGPGRGTLAQVLPPPTVSGDALPDVPHSTLPTATAAEDALPIFDNYSWRSFIAINWPAMAGAANRGKPDVAKVFGDAVGPPVWMTWKARYEIFQSKGLGPREP
jgi:hypothetical protein